MLKTKNKNLESDFETTLTKRLIMYNWFDYIRENKHLIMDQILRKKTIVIPVQFNLDIICDYLTQSANELTKYGYEIILVPFPNSRWIFKKTPNIKFNERIIKSQFTNKKANVHVLIPIRFLPLRLHKIPIFYSIDFFLTSILVSFSIKTRYPNSIVWCFHHRDYLIATLLKNRLPVVYDCVDYLNSQDPKLQKMYDHDELALIKSAKYFFVNSNVLKNLKKRLRKPDAVVPQGFDLITYSARLNPSKSEAKEILDYKRMFDKIPKPVVGYIGNLNFRFDYEIFNQVVKKLPNVSFVFTNNKEVAAEDKTKTGLIKKIADLVSQPNVYLIPRASSKKVVKEIVKYYDLGVIPYDISYSFNRYCYPMKLFEYFYMGKPVVSTPIEELKRFPKYVKIGKNAKEWEKLIKSLLSEKWPKSYQREQRRLAEENSWEKKIDAVMARL